MKRVYTLYRVSTAKQVDVTKDDIPMQRIACHEFSDRQPDWEILREFEEKGISGFKVSADKRDAIQYLKEAALAKEFGMDYTEVLAKRKGDWVEVEGEDGLSRIAYISDMVKDGELAPVEYAAQSIRDMIISTRKQRLIMTLEQDLLKDARDNGKFVIY